MTDSESVALDGRLIALCYRWFEITSCCETADRPRAERAISEIYLLLGIAPPRFEWADSPNQARTYFSAVGREEILKGDLPDPTLRTEIHHKLADPVFQYEMPETLMDQKSILRGRKPTQLQQEEAERLDRLHYLIEATVSCRGEIWVAFTVPVTNLTSWVEILIQCSLDLEKRWDYCGGIFSGQHTAPWIAWFLGAQECGVKFTEPQIRLLSLWAEIAQSCGWWCPKQDICVICERTSEFHWIETADRPVTPTMDNVPMIVVHRDGGPAIRFRDGWSVWGSPGKPVYNAR